jgi:hypothetical protein
LGFSQITRTAPWRLITLQCSQRRFTDALTFIPVTGSSWLAAQVADGLVLDASRGDP